MHRLVQGMEQVVSINHPMSVDICYPLLYVVHLPMFAYTVFSKYKMLAMLVLFVLLKCENNLDTVISHITFNSMHRGTFKSAQTFFSVDNYF